MMFDRDLPVNVAWRILRVRMWELGHSFGEIDSMAFSDVADVIGYWSEKSRVEKKLKDQKKK